MPGVLGQYEVMRACAAAGGDRFAVYDLENHEGTPVYVHAKAVVVDDVWAMAGSDVTTRRRRGRSTRRRPRYGWPGADRGSRARRRTCRTDSTRIAMQPQRATAAGVPRRKARSGRRHVQPYHRRARPVDGRGHRIEHHQLPNQSHNQDRRLIPPPQPPAQQQHHDDSDSDGRLCFGHTAAERRDAVPDTRPVGSEPDVGTPVHGLQPPVDQDVRHEHADQKQQTP
jgi:hypothetical protein